MKLSVVSLLYFIRVTVHILISEHGRFTLGCFDEYTFILCVGLHNILLFGKLLT